MFFFVFTSTLSWYCAIDDAGLNATRRTIGIPFEIPPNIPPELFVFVRIFPFLITYGSLFCDPNFSDPAKPEPNSTPFTAGIEKIALLISDSRDPKIGSPKPTGTLVEIDSIIPPNESPFFLAASILFSIFSAVVFDGHLTTFE